MTSFVATEDALSMKKKRFFSSSRNRVSKSEFGPSMDEWTTKTPNPICRLFFTIDLLTDFAALCLTDFIDWRYVHSWLVFSTQHVNCCPPGQRNYTCVMLLSSFWPTLPPPPSQTKCTVYTDSVCLGGGGGGGEICFRPYTAGILHSVSDQIQNLPNCFTTPNKMTS